MRTTTSLLTNALAGLLIALLIAWPDGSAKAQHGQDVPPAPQTTSPSGANPTAQSVQEQQLLQELRKLEGRVTIPDYKAAILEQPQGRDYQFFHEVLLPWILGIVVVAMLLALAVFYFTRGRIGADEPETGIKVERFGILERFVHWTTATSFVVLAVTGLNYVFGKRLLFPLIGPDAFAAWSQWAKFAHNAIAWPFMLGLLFMIVMWIKDNIPDRYDRRWLREFGGFLSGGHPPARRFNAGQKMIYWSVVLLGLALSVSGVVMLFPFWSLDINGMQWAQYVHAAAATLLIAVVLAHIYIGTIGMQGAYDAMGSGEVDLAWARAHHSAWVAEENLDRPRPRGGANVPAE